MHSRYRTNTPDSLQTRASLLERVKDWEDRESWARFFETYAALVYNVARRAGLADSDAEDVVQDTLLTAAKKLPEFSYDPALGSFKAWLRQIARTKVIAHWRKNRKHREGMDSLEEEGENGYLPLSERLPQSDAVDFDAIWEEQWQKDLFEAAKERVKATAKPRQYQIFHCSVVKEWPAARVMRELQVNMGQVYFARRKIARMIQEEVARLERLGR